MTLPAVREPVDVARLIKDRLKADMAARFPELSVRLELPSDWTLGSDPVLLVADDGSTLDMWPAATDPTIRITSWTSAHHTDFWYRRDPAGRCVPRGARLAHER